MKGLGIITCFAAGLLMPFDGFAMAVGARDTITLIGSTLSVDSFDSGDPAYSTNGLYSASQNKDGGDLVIQDSGAVTPSYSVHVGNAKVMGLIRTDPYGMILVGFIGSVGSKSWVMMKYGIQPGWHWDTPGIFFPDVVLPVSTWQLPFGTGAGGSGSVVVDGVAETFDHVFTVSGDYWIPASKSVYVGTNVSVRLRITTTNFAPSKIYIAGTGSEAGRMVAYLQGNAGLRPTYRTQNGRASGMVFLGLPTCLSVGIYGSVTALVYAPGAEVAIAGDGAGVVHFMGSIVCRNFRAAGHIAIHFDEDLFRMRHPIPFIFPGSTETRNVLAGSTTSLSVFPGIGDDPLTHQWRLNGLEIPGATEPGLTVTNAQLADAGWYDVVMTFSNLSGSMTSPPGHLGVFATPAAVMGSPVVDTNGSHIHVDGIPGRYAIERSSNLIDWVRFRTNSTDSGLLYFVDTDGALPGPQRFYRAVYVP